MKYFRWLPSGILWDMSWDNFVLYMASIPTYEGEEKEKIEVKDADDIF